MRRLFLIGLLLSNILWARYVALLTETASGGVINSDKDIETMKEILGDRYKFIVLNQPQATSENIRGELKRLARELKPSDTFVFFYSGHGDRFYRGDHHEADKHDDFLVTSDAYCDGTAIKDVLVDDELNYLYSKIKARKIIIIDACHSADMQKGAIATNVKRFKGCNDGFVTRGFDINPSWQKAQDKNFLHFGAAQEHESALGSPKGGRFTLALAEVIKERGDVSFAELEQEVQRRLKQFKFQPSISQYSTIDKNKLHTKDIFAVAKPTPPEMQSKTLRNILENRPNRIKVTTQKRLKAYSVGRAILIKGYPKSIQNIYLIELKGANDFKLIASKPKCIPYNGKQMCQFDNLRATKPIGTSTIYMIQTSQPLNFNNSKDSVITDEFFDGDRSLGEQLDSIDFEVGKIKIKTVL